VVRGDPDLIMISQAEGPGLELRPGWSQLRAIRGKHVCLFSPDDSKMMVRAGPRIAQAARLMAQCLAAHSSAAKP